MTDIAHFPRPGQNYPYVLYVYVYMYRAPVGAKNDCKRNSDTFAHIFNILTFDKAYDICPLSH